jgi:hypothetical protein
MGLRGVILATVGVSLALPAPAAAAPVNDSFAGALTLTGFPVEVTGSNVDATREPGEPSHDDPAFPQGERSVWWRWTPKRSGHVAVETCGSRFDTILAVYTGAALTELTQVASSAGSGWCESGARVAFFATAGVTYRLAVDGNWTVERGTATGRIRLAVRPSGSVSLRRVPGRTGDLARVIYRAAPEEPNRAEVLLDWDPSDDLFTALPEPPSPRSAFSSTTRCPLGAAASRRGAAPSARSRRMSARPARSSASETAATPPTSAFLARALWSTRARQTM